MVDDNIVLLLYMRTRSAAVAYYRYKTYNASGVGGE